MIGDYHSLLSRGILKRYSDKRESIMKAVDREFSFRSADRETDDEFPTDSYVDFMARTRVDHTRISPETMIAPEPAEATRISPDDRFSGHHSSYVSITHRSLNGDTSRNRSPSGENRIAPECSAYCNNYTQQQQVLNGHQSRNMNENQSINVANVAQHLNGIPSGQLQQTGQQILDGVLVSQGQLHTQHGNRQYRGSRELWDYEVAANIIAQSTEEDLDRLRESMSIRSGFVNRRNCIRNVTEANHRDNSTLPTEINPVSHQQNNEFLYGGQHTQSSSSSSYYVYQGVGSSEVPTSSPVSDSEFNAFNHSPVSNATSPLSGIVSTGNSDICPIDGLNANTDISTGRSSRQTDSGLRNASPSNRHNSNSDRNFRTSNAEEIDFSYAHPENAQRESSFHRRDDSPFRRDSSRGSRPRRTVRLNSLEASLIARDLGIEGPNVEDPDYQRWLREQEAWNLRSNAELQEEMEREFGPQIENHPGLIENRFRGILQDRISEIDTASSLEEDDENEETQSDTDLDSSSNVVPNYTPMSSSNLIANNFDSRDQNSPKDRMIHIPANVVIDSSRVDNTVVVIDSSHNSVYGQACGNYGSSSDRRVGGRLESNNTIRNESQSDFVNTNNVVNTNKGVSKNDGNPTKNGRSDSLPIASLRERS